MGTLLSAVFAQNVNHLAKHATVQFHFAQLAMVSKAKIIFYQVLV